MSIPYDFDAPIETPLARMTRITKERQDKANQEKSDRIARKLKKRADERASYQAFWNVFYIIIVTCYLQAEKEKQDKIMAI